jgi:hypothetical protein
MRGLDQVRGEWNLVTMAWNLKRMSACCIEEEEAKGAPTPHC